MWQLVHPLGDANKAKPQSLRLLSRNLPSCRSGQRLRVRPAMPRAGWRLPVRRSCRFRPGQVPQPAAALLPGRLFCRLAHASLMPPCPPCSAAGPPRFDGSAALWHPRSTVPAIASNGDGCATDLQGSYSSGGCPVLSSRRKRQIIKTSSITPITNEPIPAHAAITKMSMRRPSFPLTGKRTRLANATQSHIIAC